LGLSPTSNVSGRNFTLPESAEVSCEKLVLHEIIYKSAKTKIFMKVQMKVLERKRELEVVNLLWVLVFLALLSLLCPMATLQQTSSVANYHKN